MPFQKPAAPLPPFGIRVVDEVTGRGVPLVEIETVNRVLFVTDSGGWAAVGAPDLMNAEVFFHVRGHGCAFPKDGFGYAGVRLRVTPGGTATVRAHRVNVAERVCRLTGGGIYVDSVLLGKPTPLREPVLSGQVLGQDSAMAALYKNRMLWFWGDTDRIGYPLGNFRTTGAVATLPRGQMTVDAGLDYRYFTGSDGFARAMCPTSKPGPIWVGGLAVVEDRLIAHYSRMENLGKRLEHGYVEWDENAEQFRFVKELPTQETWRFLDGHPIRMTEQGTDYLAGGFCYPLVRAPATRDTLLDPSSFEAFTCLDVGGNVVRDARGDADYRWQKAAPPITPQRESELVKQGKLRHDEARFLPRDSDGGKEPVIAHGGSVTWNPWRKKWLLIATRLGGADSLLGDIFYAEADAPVGPWRRAVRIVTHKQYTFYNPVHHPFLDAAGGRIIYFEGTYTAEFSGNTHLTPRYNYNQILYRLDLADPRIRAAAAAG